MVIIETFELHTTIEKLKEFANDKIGYMYDSNLSLIPFFEESGIRYYNRENIKYWISQFIKYYVDDEDRSLGKYIYDFELTTIMFVEIIYKLGFEDYYSWAKKAARDLYYDSLRYFNNFYDLFFFIRSGCLHHNEHLLEQIIDDIPEPHEYSSVMHINSYLFLVSIYNKKETEDIEFATNILVERQLSDGSWNNNNGLGQRNKGSTEGSLMTTILTSISLSLSSLSDNKDTIARASNWILGKCKENIWSSDLGRDVALYTILSIESLELAKGNDTKRYSRKEFYMTKEKYDVFISHANIDKLKYVDELYSTFKRLGIKIFYDKDSINWGDNWKERILSGVETSEFAVIVISQNFFGREWTNRELKEFLHKQNSSGEKIILPLLYGISINEFNDKYPELNEIQVLEESKYSQEAITIQLAKELIKFYKER